MKGKDLFWVILLLLVSVVAPGAAAIGISVFLASKIYQLGKESKG